MTIKEIERLLKLARSLGIRRLSVSGFEAEWFQAAQAPQEHKIFIPKLGMKDFQSLQNKITDPMQSVPDNSYDALGASAMPSDEDMAVWHTNGPLPSEIKEEESKNYKRLEEAIATKDKPH